jgi:FkbM family methyltransferase
MKQELGWWFPDHEQHLPAWMRSPKGYLVLNGRPSYQGKKQQAALAAVRQHRTAVDVGGHIGLWSYNLAAAFEQVHAFEPVEAHRACFARNVEAANVTLHACALGREEGSVSIHTAPTSTGDSWVKGGGNIPMVTLDSLQLTEVDFIKIDCEGYEENVLRGAIETIKRDLPVIIVEQKRDMATARFGLEPLGAVKFLQSLGYRVAQEISGDYLMVPA